jgi:hypothetical protein
LVFSFWPLRWINTFFNGSKLGDAGAPFLTTIWRAAQMLDVSLVFPWMIVIITVGNTFWAWRRVNAAHVERSDHDRLFAYLALSTIAFLIITPYAFSYRYVLLYAMVVPWLAGWRLDVVLGIYLLTLLPVARVYIGIENSWIDIAYPITIFAEARQPAGSG